jgi:predicted nucleic-acid-binding protein
MKIIADTNVLVRAIGGDFADGVIAYEGQWLRGEAFVTLDRKAVAALTARGHVARLV